MRLNRVVLGTRLAMGLWVFGALSTAVALPAGCALPEAPATQVTSATPLATAGLPPQATPTPAPSEMPTQTATPTPRLSRLPAGTIALYGLGEKQSLDLYALGADGSVIALGRELPVGSLASHGGRWIVHLDAPQPARAVVLEDLQDGRQYTIPLGVDCSQENCIVGLWAFDREDTRLASAEVAIDRWAVVVVDLRDGSSRRFEATRAPQGEAYPMPPGTPLGWAATGELLLDTFHPFSEGGSAGIWAITLPADGSSAAIATLGRRQLVAGGAYLHPQLSPDGAHLLYLARDRAYTPAGYTLEGGFEDVAVNQLWSLDVASGQGTKLVEVRDGGALGYAAAWSPDGREALFAQGRYADGQRLSELTLKAVDAAGAVREIGPLAAQGQLTDLRWCRPSLALATVYAGNGVFALYTVDLATGRPAFVAKGQQVSVLAVTPAQAGQEARPSPTPPQTGAPVLRWLDMIDGETGWALADGSLLRTADGGRRWSDVTPPGVESGAIGWEFLDGARAWVAATGGEAATAATGGEAATAVTVYRTEDGGRNWQSSALPATFGGGVMGLYLSAGDLFSARLLVVPTHGMSSSPGLLYATADGGAQWTLVAGHEVAGGSDTLPYGGAIRFTSSTAGWISGVTANTLPASLSVTRDGGRTWQPVELPLPPGYSQGHLSIGLPRLFGAGREEGFVAAEFWPESRKASEFATILYMTQDGGRTWQATTPIRSGGALDLINAEEGWVWATEPGCSVWGNALIKGTLYHTRDGGRTWEALGDTLNLTAFLQQGGEVAQLDFVSEEIGWAIVQGADGRATQLVKTQGGGHSWDPVDARIGEPTGVTLSVVDGWTGVIKLDNRLCFQVDALSADWTVDGMPGGFASFTRNADKASFNITNVDMGQRLTLDLALDNLRRGALGSYVQEVSDFAVDGRAALWVTFAPEADCRFCVLVIAPDCGDGAHALFISAKQASRESFESFLRQVHFTAASAGPLPHSMKGYELYSWAVGNDWRFTLTTGTNRVKSYDEITAGGEGVTAEGWVNITVTGVEAIKAALAQLPRGESVFWADEVWWEQVHKHKGEAKGNLAQPDQAIVDDVVRHCEQLGIELQRP